MAVPGLEIYGAAVYFPIAEARRVLAAATADFPGLLFAPATRRPARLGLPQGALRRRRQVLETPAGFRFGGLFMISRLGKRFFSHDITDRADIELLIATPNI